MRTFLLAVICIVAILIAFLAAPNHLTCERDGATITYRGDDLPIGSRIQGAALFWAARAGVDSVTNTYFSANDGEECEGGAIVWKDVGITVMTPFVSRPYSLPSPDYLLHPPQYVPSSPAYPLPRELMSLTEATKEYEESVVRNK